MTPTPQKTARFDFDISYGPDRAQKMDIHFITGQSDAMPAVVYIHGGGWVEGDKSSPEADIYIKELLKRGYVIFSLNYRLAPAHPFPAQIEDIKLALRYIRAHAASFYIDPDRIGIYGSSAGGHLAALAGVTSPVDGFDKGEYLEQSSRVQAVVDLFGPADLNQLSIPGIDSVIAQTFGSHPYPSEPYRLASPVAYASPDDPPFLIIHGDIDRVVPLDQSQRMHAALQAAGADSQLVVVKNGGHGFYPHDAAIDPSAEEISTRIADFFDAHLK